MIADVLCEYYPKKLKKIGINDRFGESGKGYELLEKFKLDSISIASKVREAIKR